VARSTKKKTERAAETLIVWTPSALRVVAAAGATVFPVSTEAIVVFSEPSGLISWASRGRWRVGRVARKKVWSLCDGEERSILHRSFDIIYYTAKNVSNVMHLIDRKRMYR
jgi:hypothetical protein